MHTLARKLNITPESLQNHYEYLCTQKSNLLTSQQKLAELNTTLSQVEQEYYNYATKLTAIRQQTADILSKKIITKLKKLELPLARFMIKINPMNNQTISPNGLETIEFQVSTNPGQELGSLKKIASGGELSRISLAIEVITAEKMVIPTLIFDEVDTGISGKTAEKVGQLMRQLGTKTQLLCITHLPQVATQGNHHFKIIKHQTQEKTSTAILKLDKQQSVEEIAKLMGGEKLPLKH